MALIKERTKKRKGENAIGKIIYGFLLFAPLISIFVRCAYVIVNKNAFESYSENIEQTYTQVTSYEQIHLNLKYEFNDSISPTGAVNRVNMDMFDIYTNNSSYQQPVAEIYTYKEYFTYFSIIASNNSYSLGLYSSNTQVVTNKFFAVEKEIFFSFKLISYDGQLSNIFSNLKLIEQKNTNTLDKVFEYSIEETEEYDLFNWAKETGTYTVLETTTTGLGITNTFVPFLMAYWLLISVIYFIFDIALILVWAVHDKIHELKDSI